MRIDDELILERYRHPHAKGFDGAFDGAAAGDNPFCGDAIEVRVSLGRGAEGVVLERAAFDGYACSLCAATADLLMERARGMAPAAVRALGPDDLLRWWGGLEVGRTRKGCVELPLSVLKRALDAAEEHAGASLLQ
ncbi:iron-sulfur cluster assembly scaffold protein [Eggerthella sinensis]|uniref:iron-sulfur cluster assembly scaffold protein n=1 Tax=Eggerthella sinensis TaxID=242230 RepID=UPI0013148173|nr:iron-sulfur cluster assembly scaffold protein [Eggerthella sinensis]